MDSGEQQLDIVALERQGSTGRLNISTSSPCQT